MRDEIIAGMQKAFFATAWASQAEETGNSSVLSGQEIMDIMPTEIDPAAIHAARTLIMDLESANGKTVEALYASVQDKLSPDKFGHYTAMQAMGEGTGLGDFDISKTDVSVPYVEFGSHSLEQDYFVESASTRARPR